MLRGMGYVVTIVCAVGLVLVISVPLFDHFLKGPGLEPETREEAEMLRDQRGF